MKRVLAVLWFVAAPSQAADLCFGDFSSYLPCPPNDIAWLVDRVGFRTNGPPCAGGPDETYYRVTLSASSTDPYVNTGPLPADLKLYLWNTGFPLVAAPAGYGWGNLHLQITGSLEIDSYEPIAPGSHSWDGPSRTVTFGTCEDAAPSLIGAFVILQTTATAPESWGRVKSLYR